MEDEMDQHPHYHHDERTGQIRFNREHRYYQIERGVFASNGINIDEIKSFRQYFEFKTAFRYEMRKAFHHYMKTKKTLSIENKFTQSVILNNKKEADRLESLLDRMREAHMSIIK